LQNLNNNLKVFLFERVVEDGSWGNEPGRWCLPAVCFVPQHDEPLIAEDNQ